MRSFLLSTFFVCMAYSVESMECMECMECMKFQFNILFSREYFSFSRFRRLNLNNPDLSNSSCITRELADLDAKGNVLISERLLE